MNFTLKIVTPKGIYLEKEVESLTVRTTNGQIGILAHHLPLASPLEISEMHYVADGQTKHFAIAGGFVYVGKNETTIIANAIEADIDIDVARAKAAMERAQERIKANEADLDLARAELALKKAINRINVRGIQ